MDLDKLTHDPFSVMVGSSNHYAVGRLDVNRFCMANRWDCCARDCMKYLSRHKKKDGVRDVLKALHYAGLRREFLKQYGWPAPLSNFTLHSFLLENEISSTSPEGDALTALSLWVHTDAPGHQDQLVQIIHSIISTYPSDPPMSGQEKISHHQV